MFLMVIWNKLNCQYVVGKGGRYMVGMWSVCGRYVVGTWSVCGRFLIMKWSPLDHSVLFCSKAKKKAINIVQIMMLCVY